MQERWCYNARDGANNANTIKGKVTEHCLCTPWPRRQRFPVGKGLLHLKYCALKSGSGGLSSLDAFGKGKPLTIILWTRYNSRGPYSTVLCYSAFLRALSPCMHLSLNLRATFSPRCSHSWPRIPSGNKSSSSLYIHCSCLACSLYSSLCCAGALSQRPPSAPCPKRSARCGSAPAPCRCSGELPLRTPGGEAADSQTHHTPRHFQARDV